METKQAEVGAGAKVPHLSYVGDATIGERANIGAGVIFVNYDGVAKHRTQVGEAAFVGSNSSLVAPVTVGDGAYVAAGSAVDQGRARRERSAVARGQQRNMEGWVERRRAGHPVGGGAPRAPHGGRRRCGAEAGGGIHGTAEAPCAR